VNRFRFAIDSREMSAFSRAHRRQVRHRLEQAVLPIVLRKYVLLGWWDPMKRITWLCHVIGTVPGALPPVIGWAAARNGLGGEPLVFFAIMFLWQLPHSLSIARLLSARLRARRSAGCRRSRLKPACHGCLADVYFRLGGRRRRSLSRDFDGGIFDAT
jgi:UbiA prenyltransferase family